MHLLLKPNSPGSQVCQVKAGQSGVTIADIEALPDETELAHRSYARAEFDEEASSVSSSVSRSVAELPRSADGDDDSELLVQNFRNGYRGMSCD